MEVSIRRRLFPLCLVLAVFLGTVVVFIHEDLGTFIPALQIMQGNFYLWFQSLTLGMGSSSAGKDQIIPAGSFKSARGVYHPAWVRTAAAGGAGPRAILFARRVLA